MLMGISLDALRSGANPNAIVYVASDKNCKELSGLGVVQTQHGLW